MATTTNYGWTTPDDTALVKDGASAIRSLGTSVDTTTKNLNPSTTLGDIEYRSSTANTNTRLGIGSTGQVLTVSGGVPSWATSSSGGMTLLSTTTLSGSSTTISSISGSYNNLQLVIRNFTPSTQSQITMGFNADAGTNYLNFNSSLGGSNTAYNSASISLSSDQHTSGTNLIVSNIFDYSNTATRKLTHNLAITQNNGTPTMNLNDSRGSWNSTSAITSIILYTGGTMSGTALLYGVK